MTVASMDPRISIHHVGGRGGNRSFPELPRFERDFVNVLYDADPDCIEQVHAANLGRASELHVLPFCLAEASGKRNLNINYDPFTSSLLDFNEEYGGYYQQLADHDYVFAETFAPAERREIEVVTLDQVLASSAAPVPPPNFLSLDTQGSEYDILCGASGALKSDVVALVVEVEFHPLYRQQKLFGDLTDFLAEKGFHFVRFLFGTRVAPYRAPIGLRADGFHLFDDALFLRRIEDIVKLEVGGVERRLLLKKLAFVSIAYNQLEYALECLNAARRIQVAQAVPAGTQPSYLAFLHALEREIESLRPLRLRSFAEKFTFSESKQRFDMSWRKRNVTLNVSVKKEIFAAWSGVERLLIDHGFDKLADIVKTRRLVQTSVHEYLASDPDIETEQNIVDVQLRLE